MCPWRGLARLHTLSLSSPYTYGRPDRQMASQAYTYLLMHSFESANQGVCKQIVKRRMAAQTPLVQDKDGGRQHPRPWLRTRNLFMSLNHQQSLPLLEVLFQTQKHEQLSRMPSQSISRSNRSTRASGGRTRKHLRREYLRPSDSRQEIWLDGWSAALDSDRHSLMVDCCAVPRSQCVPVRFLGS